MTKATIMNMKLYGLDAGAVAPCAQASEIRPFMLAPAKGILTNFPTARRPDRSGPAKLKGRHYATAPATALLEAR